MNLRRFVDEIAAVAPLRNETRSSPEPLFYQMQYLIDDENEGYRAGIGDAMYTRMRDLAITSRSMEEGERHAEPLDINAVLGKCKKEVYKPKASARGKAKAADEQTECPVCLESFEANDELLRLPCNHIFHPDCLVPWIKGNHDRCPFCRAQILLPKPNGGNHIAGPSNIPIASPTHQFHPSPTTPIGNVPTVTNSPTPMHHHHNNNNDTHATRNMPINLGIPSLHNNLQNIPTSNYARPIIDVPMSHGIQPNYPPHAPIIDVPISHGIPSNYPSHAPSRAAYRKREDITDVPISHGIPSNYPSHAPSRGAYRKREDIIDVPISHGRPPNYPPHAF